MSLDGRLSWTLRPTTASATALGLDLPAVPVGHYALLVNAGGTWTGVTTRIGNRAPVGRAASVTTPEDVALSIRVAGGDRDGDNLSFRVTAPPARGTLSGTGATYVYTPQRDFFGTDTLRFRAHDGAADSPDATVTITVTPVNDAPVGAADAYVTAEDTVLRSSAAVGLLANDTDVDSTALAVVMTSVSTPRHGNVAVAADGSFVYTPDAEFSGSDDFVYRVTDGMAESEDVLVSIDVTPVNDAPVARPDVFTTAEDQPLSPSASVLDNDSDPDSMVLTATIASTTQHGQLSFASDGTFRYVPGPDYFGSDGFTYRSSDGAALSAPATVTIEVTPVNDAPVSLGDEYPVSAERGLVVTATGGVLLNDTDADGDPLIALLVAPPREGSLSLDRDGGFRYTPRPGFEGVDDFGYQASDGTARAVAVVVRLHVGVDRPVAVPDTYDAREDEPLVVDRFRGVLLNDDGQGRPLTAQLVEGVEHGFLTLRDDGSFEFVPEANRFGVERFRYRAANGLFDTEIVTVTIDVAELNDPPTTPLLLEPADGARVATGRLTFAWAASTDVDGDTLVYEVEVRRSSGETVRALFAADPFLTLGGTDALPPGQYTWSVAANDGRDGRSDRSPPRALTVLTEDGSTPDPEGDGGGCGCATSTTSNGSPLAILFALSLLLTTRRRR